MRVELRKLGMVGQVVGAAWKAYMETGASKEVSVTNTSPPILDGGKYHQIEITMTIRPVAAGKKAA